MPTRNREQAARFVENRESLAQAHDPKRLHRILPLFLVLSCGETTAPGPVLPPPVPEVSGSHRASLERGDSRLAIFSVDIVNDPMGRRLGLSAFAPLTEGQGLILAWAQPRRVCIWNQPVPYPIDVAYVDGHRRVIALHSFEANDTRSVCQDGVRQVLETRRDALTGAQRDDRLHVETAP